MSDLPILFSAPMVRAILREIDQPGTGKTQTRRTFVSLRGGRYRTISEFGRSDTPGYDWHFRDREKRWHDLRHSELLSLLKYRVGDRLYVREAWRSEANYDDLSPSAMGGEESVRYEADGAHQTWDFPAITKIGRLRAGMHMPRWASRITLIVTDVRVQRLQECTAEDARDEGVDRRSRMVRQIDLFGSTPESRNAIFLQACLWEYEKLWNEINAKRGFGWDTNPWVAAYTFQPILGNIDQVRP
jgi:hypothetical protein